MKKIALAFISLTVTAATFGQTVFTYGKNSVSKDEFLRAFNKNPNVTGDRKKALREYLDLYINFKLKVQAAYDAGLDKDATQQYELQNFRRQIADNVINEQANVKDLVKQAFERGQKEIRLAHVFVEVPANADTAQAFAAIQAAYKDLKAGKAFGEVAQQYSTDEATKLSKGELGYITAFTLPYDMESVAYSLKPNAYSAPFKSKIGYHIFMNLGERKSLGTRKVAQILVALPPQPSSDQIAAASRKADSVYQLLSKGENFGSLAGSVSNDISSSNNKGELPEFTTGTYSPEFESVAFSLAKAGDISKPFRTAHGFHIVKLIEAKQPVTDIADPVNFATIQEKVVRDSRMEVSKKDLIEKKLTLIKYKPATFNRKDLFAFTDTAMQNGKSSPVKGITDNTALFSFAKQTIKAADWIRFVKAVPVKAEASSKNYEYLYKEFINASADEYYRNNLDDYNTDYARQVKEFKEANLLFGIMEKNVWGKANNDSSGLNGYYSDHKSKYMWPASANALMITCNNEALVNAIQQRLKAAPSDWRQITSSNGPDVIADSGRYELTQLQTDGKATATPGAFTNTTKNENDGTYTFSYVLNVYNEPGQRSFDDARGMVISDYQQVLEDKWIGELRKKYPVKVNEQVFETIK